MNNNFMQKALKLAIDNANNANGGPFGAVIVKDNQIIAEGSNCVTSHNDPSAHAEVTAIRNACKKLGNFSLKGCEIYTSCEPCPMCLATIYWARLDKIYYCGSKDDAAKGGFDDEFIYQEIAKKIEERSIPMLRLMEDQAFDPFAAWQRQEDKILY